MAKAVSKSKRVVQPSRMQTKSTNSCPVEKLAIQVGELWEAHNGIDESRAGSDALVRDMDDYRSTLEHLASFQRAESLGGALFQIMIAQLESGDVFSRLSDEEQKTYDATQMKVDRLLMSAARAIVMALGKDGAPLKSVLRIYCGEGPDIEWLDEIPQLAVAGRNCEEAAKAAA